MMKQLFMDEAVPAGSGLNSIRRRLLFHNAFQPPRNPKQRARRLRLAIVLWFVLCASLSALLFTWTVATTVQDNNKLMADHASPLTMSLRHSFRRAATLSQERKFNKQARSPVSEPSQLASSVLPLVEQRSHASPPPLEAPGSNVQSESPPPPPRLPENTITPTHQEVPEILRIPQYEPVVQVISTRFMQHQPHLIELGMARLELFKTLCLPTLLQQTSQNFLWVIRADPDLAAPIRKGLLHAMRNATRHTHNLHAVVIGSNDNPNGFRRDIIERPDQVWTKNYALLKHYQEAAQSRVVLETRLDADDGLHVHFIEVMQKEAVKYLGNPQKHNWLVWCAGTHVEWQYRTPWEVYGANNSTTTEEGKNSTSDLDSTYGSLLPGLTRGCITPGLTKGYGKDVAYEEVPEGQHHMLHWQMKPCKEDMPSWQHCLVIWKRLVPTAIRGRTPTSAGMQFVLGKHVSYLSKESQDKLGLQENNMYDKQNQMWESIIKRFKITKESAARMRRYLTRHIEGITKENLKGQCTKGHSCKNGTQQILVQMVQDLNSSSNVV